VAKLLKADGSSEQVAFSNPKLPSPEELRKAIGGGWIELVRTADGTMVVDSDGHAKGFGVNIEATIIYHKTGGAGNLVVGDALLLEAHERVD
jgi:hypothetical protein